MGEPLAKFWLFASVSGTDTASTKEIEYKKSQLGKSLQNSSGYLQLRRLRWIA